MQNASNLLRRHSSIMPLLITFTLFLCCTTPQKAITYRDTWGIPHIYADSKEALAYAFGYAQAEDRLNQILQSYRYAEGTLAEAFGEEYIETDYVQCVWQHAKISQDKFTELPLNIQQIAIYFIAGIKQYMQDHPEKVPDWVPEIHPWHIVALGRTYIWGWPLGQAMGDLRRGKQKMDAPHHSNQWVVSANRTAVDAPIALIDPHLNFATTGHFYEARLHAGDLQICGMTVVGTPFIGLGHNRYISWAATTGGPDCADVYELEINPDNPMQYKYNGQWQEINTERIIIRVKQEDGFKEIEKTIERCHYGPIQERHGNKAYAIKCAYENEVSLAEQMFKINKAKNIEEFKDALAMCQMMPQNIMCASVEGDIYYARTGMVPIRPEGYDWDYPVPGNSKDSEWLGIHAHEDMVQISNPESGFMQNCNISPGTMMPNSPLTADKYPEYIYNDTQNHSNPRGRTAVRLLSSEENMTVERAKEIALDTSVDGYRIWQNALKTAYKSNSISSNDLQEAVDLILSWNGRLDADNNTAPLYRFWRRACSKLEVQLTATEDESIKDFLKKDQKKMISAIQYAIDYLNEKFGSFKVTWGETVRLKRGDKTWPVSGGAFDNGLSVLRAVDGRLSNETGITIVSSGQSCCMLVVLKNPVHSFSILPWGESDDPESSHYTDQAEKLFSKSKFKSTYFNKEELMNNLKSQKELTVPKI